LWPDIDAEKAAKSLDVAASILRSVLRAGNEKNLLLTTHSGDVSTVGLPNQQTIWVDADAFESHLTHAARVEQEGKDSLPYLEAAQHLARGEFLEDDVYEDWTQTRRHAIDAVRRRLLHRLAATYIQRGAISQAESCLQSFLIENPTDEDALCQLMGILAQQGRRQEAIDLYKRTARTLQEDQCKKPSSRTRELAERIYKEPITIEKNIQIITSGAKQHVQAMDALMVGPNQQQSPEDVTQHWLLATLSDLTHLIDGGWTVSDILASLQTTLSGLVAISSPSRQHLLRLASGALLGDRLSVVDDYTSTDAWQLAAALNVSNATCWPIFNTSPISSVLLSGQVQMHLLRQLHDHLPSQVMPFMYSSTYRLIGADLFFQSRYAEALQAHKQAYFAAVEACDPWNMAESLSWQGGVWKACGQQHKAIEETEKALRLAAESDNPQTYSLRARLYAHLAESAALLQQPEVVAEKLAVSAELLRQFDSNEEFDASAWQQYQATCAFYLGDARSAASYFQQALDNLKPNWMLQRAYTAQFLVQAHLKLGELGAAMKAARVALPYILSTNSLLLTSSFIEDMQQLHTLISDNPEVETFVEETLRQLRPLAERTVSRYLEAKL
jgi:DNA-binding SARP family transcriptional activator